MASYITNGKIKVGYEMLPDRKRPSITVWDGNTVKVYGSLRNLAEAEEWFMYLVEAIGLKVD